MTGTTTAGCRDADLWAVPRHTCSCVSGSGGRASWRAARQRTGFGSAGASPSQRTHRFEFVGPLAAALLLSGSVAAYGEAPKAASAPVAAVAKDPPPLRLAITKSFKESGGGQQGIATDGKHVYVQYTTQLVKYDLEGKLLARGEKSRWHHGGICHHDGKIYAAVSECARKGSKKHWVYVYDAGSLKKLAEYDIGKKFDVCAGGIACHDHHFYVAESYYDNDHDDYIVQFDAEFKPVRSYRIRFKCPYGIQGLDYLPSIGKFMVNSHGKAFYLIDPDFDRRTLEPGTAPFALQDVASLNATTVLINDRAGKRVVFVRIKE